MKKLLFIPLVLISLYINSTIAMKKEPYDGKKKAESLRKSFCWDVEAMTALEDDWKRGGNMAAFYPLNEYHGGYFGGILVGAVRNNVLDVTFIEYLINNGADVHRRWIMDKSIFGKSKILCLPIAVASLHGNPQIVKTLIEYGCLTTLDDEDKTTLLIRFIRELKKEKVEDYCICIEDLIKAGCNPDHDFKGQDLSPIAYKDFDCYGMPDSFASLGITSPLIVAIKLGFSSIVNLLLKLGADPDKKYDGKSARDIAEKKGLFQKSIGWLMKAKEEKNILELGIDKSLSEN